MGIGLHGQKLFPNERFHCVGLVLGHAREGDMTCILLGRIPFVLKDEGDHEFFIGEAYGNV